MVGAKPERRRVRRRKTRPLSTSLRHALIIVATAVCVYAADVIVGHDVLGIAKLVRKEGRVHYGH